MGNRYYWRNKPKFFLVAQVYLTATDFFTRWVEAIPLQKLNEDVVMDFLQNHIMTRFGVPISLVFNNATYFSFIRLIAFSNERGIKLHYSANYYPQGNGLQNLQIRI